MLPQLRFHPPWPPPWGRRDVRLLGSEVLDACGTAKASWGANPSCSNVVCSWPGNPNAALPPPWGLTPPSPVRLMAGISAAPAAEPSQGTVPVAVGGDIWTWRMFSRVSHDAGDTTMPQRGLDPPSVAGTGSPAKRCWSFAPQFWGCVLVALSDAHKKTPFPIPEETDLTPVCNISASSAVPAPEGARVSLLGAPGGCHPAPSHGNSFSLMLCGQNTSLLGRSLQCLQLL
ncbi:uncharacterized protein LOC142418124 [Mycteria americana]|uniref:uncharacterized protein LOC142418124 n=1 Tax=Mycteria americana TaxID=33587 RepID=UPI003F58F63B